MMVEGSPVIEFFLFMEDGVMFDISCFFCLWKTVYDVYGDG